MQLAYDWSIGTFSMMTNWGTITFVVIVYWFFIFQEKSGLRYAVLLMAFLIFTGAGLRTLSTDTNVFYYLAHFGSILNGIAGILVMSAPAALSAAWFPPNERMLATSISQSAAFLGNGFSFLIGPVLVQAPQPIKVHTDNDTIVDEIVIPNNMSMINQTIVTDLKYEIREYMLINAFIALVFLFLTLIYFPEQPPTPPSASATVERTPVNTSIRKLLKNRDFILCALAYGLSGGTLLAWQVIIHINYLMKNIFPILCSISVKCQP